MSPTATDVPLIAPPQVPVFRVGRKPDPFRPTPWRILRLRDHEIGAGSNDAHIGGRFDDPAAQTGLHEARRFRTVYFSSQRAGAIGETIGPRQVAIERLHQITLAPRLPRGLADVVDDEPIERIIEGLVDPADPSRGLVRHDWYATRIMGSARLGAPLQIVNLFDGSTVQHLRQALAPMANALGIDDIDYSTIVGPNRRFTQAVANYFYEQINDATDQPAFDGLGLTRVGGHWRIVDQHWSSEGSPPDGNPTTTVSSTISRRGRGVGALE